MGSNIFKLMITISRIKKGGDAISELEEIHEEHWEHARHCENERLWFTNIYAVVMAAILVFVRETGCNPQNLGPTLLLALFGLVLSVLGFMMVIALSLGYEHYIGDIFMIYYYWDKIEFFRHPKKPFFFVRILLYFYEFTIALFATLLLFYATVGRDSHTPFYERLTLSILPFIIVFAVIESLYKLKWEKYFTEFWRFEKALKNDTEGIYRKEWNKLFKDPDFREKIVKDAEEKGIIKPRKKIQSTRNTREKE